MRTEMVEQVIQRFSPQLEIPLSWSVLEQNTEPQAAMTIAGSVIVCENGWMDQ